MDFFHIAAGFVDSVEGPVVGQIRTGRRIILSVGRAYLRAGSFFPEAFPGLMTDRTFLRRSLSFIYIAADRADIFFHTFSLFS